MSGSWKAWSANDNATSEGSAAVAEIRRPIRRLFTRSTWPETSEVAHALRTETVGGVLLLLGVVVAMVMANTPLRGAYERIANYQIGPHIAHLDLPMHAWAGDGLLAIFFFVAGLELKRELVVGDLRDRSKAVLPVVAAASGVVVPALIYLAVVGSQSELSTGWAIPTATDIAFALAVLAIVGTHLPSALRAFLLTLAVVDDLIAIVIIAVVYTSELSVWPLVGAMVPLAAFAGLTQRRITTWWLLVPLALATWVLVHASGVHATVAGVLLGLAVPVTCRATEEHSVGERLEHAIRPISAGIAVPLFAFFSSGVSITGDALSTALRDRVTLAIAAALIVGKPVGVFLGTWLVARFTRAELAEDLAWSDVFGLALLAGIGFTVSLLIGELAFGVGSPHDNAVKIAVLGSSLIAAMLASVVLRLRNRVYRKICELEAVDADGDGVPDVYSRTN
jgi:NhaA family Na+:H+ antiporter